MCIYPAIHHPHTRRLIGMLLTQYYLLFPSPDLCLLPILLILLLLLLAVDALVYPCCTLPLSNSQVVLICTGREGRRGTLGVPSSSSRSHSHTLPPTPLWHTGSGTCWSGKGSAVIQTAVRRYMLSHAVALTPLSSSGWSASHPSCYPLVGLGPVPISLLLAGWLLLCYRCCVYRPTVYPTHLRA